MVEWNKRAKEAKNKPSALGRDIDIEAYRAEGRSPGAMDDLSELEGAQRDALEDVGIDVEDTTERTSGSFLQVDHENCLARATDPNVEVLDIRSALEKYDWLDDYWWRAVKIDTDKYTAHSELALGGGYFVHVKAGATVEMPLQTCLLLNEDDVAQTVHNIVIIEEGASVRLFTGCATGAGVKRGLHIGVSEFYVKKDARLTFTMVHNWSDNLAVRPRSVALVDEGGYYVSNYIAMRPVETLQAYPTVYLKSGATAKLNSVMYAHPGSEMDVGGRVVLEGADATAEVISRAVTAGGKIIARGHLLGKVAGIKAHLECSGLILEEGGHIHAIPELEATDLDLDMSHEAAVGKIAQDEINYLRARGLSEEDATSLIVRGFLDIEMEDVKSELKNEIDRLFAGDEGF